LFNEQFLGVVVLPQMGVDAQLMWIGMFPCMKDTPFVISPWKIMKIALHAQDPQKILF
jgi:hypothetical protein